MGLILDSSVVVAAERGGLTVTALLFDIAATHGNQKAALASVGLSELVHGIYRAKTPKQGETRRAFLDELLVNVSVFPYSREAAMLGGRIDGETQRNGITIDFPDLLIGATALSIGYAVLTANVRHFQLIPGLKVVPFRQEELPVRRPS